MLPKIAVAAVSGKKQLLDSLNLVENRVLEYEGNEAKVADFRRWLNSAVNNVRTRPELSLVIWQADELSAECQAVLLKPMEELGEEIRLILVVENENKLSPTILSRGVVEYLMIELEEKTSFWSEVRKCWSSGPSACISLSDRLSKEEGITLLSEVIGKLKNGLSTEVNSKRLEILDLAISSLSDLKQSNINHKLSLDNFLIGSWRMIKN